MKTVITLCLFFVGLSFNASAQVPGEKLVPKPVLTAFATDFPGITPKRWEVKLGKNYEAVMVHDNKPARARYFATGKKRWTSYHWSGPSVPAVVSSGILATFAGFKVDWATQVINHVQSTDRFLVRLSKPGHILKVLVNTADGSVVVNGDKEEMGEEDAPQD